MPNESSDALPDFLLEWLPHPGPRFEALMPALHATEAAISHQSDQRALRAQADLRRRGVSPEEASNHLAVLHHETEQLLAKVLRGGFLVSLWSLFESSVKDLGEYVRAERNLTRALKVGAPFLAEVDEFFRASLSIVPFPDEEERRQLESLRKFRNGLAHRDGSFAEVPTELAKEGMVYGFCLVGHSHEFAVPTAEYVRSSLELLARVSQSLAANVFEGLALKNGTA